ncbi:cytoplasmic glycerophosphodiester phosphodiesterase [Methyloligella halotolerans]|uniref:Cytoplasmic glycerophosphodiester phosphodiesterase n=1 Tax=Methyloligella halotolerans TaxID=1177755 RepID=A0A1E2S1R6_9HYPH|nr:glycerophosphodiester phosphodiesterase family protein [Methyloligella halotolerans]ODA68362.1 cytoplasmic glycerophosphodiester phosphodiesterase [Methyloligella halotolerans]
MAYSGGLDWLKRPIAHRGLHDRQTGIVENTASAVEAAIAAGFGMEVDLRAARGHVPVVFHDETLERLTEGEGKVADHDVETLRQLAMRGTGDRILTLPELLDLVAGRAPLILEIKSEWNRDRRYEANIAEALRNYNGPVAIMSFDPWCVAAFRRLAPDLPRGLVSEWMSRRSFQKQIGIWQRFAMRHLLTASIAKPHFIAYDIQALPTFATRLARWWGLPLLTWTVRTEFQRAKAEALADAMIFEEIRP